MKLLLDFLPLILFFGTYQWAGAHKDAAAGFANEHFRMLTSGGVVAPDQAPILLATLVAIAATLTTVLWLKLRRRPVELMMWVTLAIVVILGGLTVWFHDETFIKWKPTVVYWALGALYAVSEMVLGKNLLRAALGEQVPLPEAAWTQLNRVWVVFFAVLGVLNLGVAYSVSTEAWVKFKVFGATGLSVLFVLGQGLYIQRHLLPPASDTASGEAGGAP